MLQGYRTYITLALAAAYNIARAAGLDFGDVKAEDIDAAVNTILVVAAAIFRFLATKKKQS